MDLFETAAHGEQSKDQPLAERLRPHNFEQFVGQTQSVHKNTPLMRSILEKGRVPNLILWGPPGTGKTTFGLLLAHHLEAEFVTVNAVDTGAKKLREIGQQAKDRRLQYSKPTILFVDEIHRLNRAQQDVLLPFAEKGDFSLVGATTENPSYELNSALLSRARLIVFERHSLESLKQLAQQAQEELGVTLTELMSSEALDELCLMANGDGRSLLNSLEQVFTGFSLARGGEPLVYQDGESVSQVDWPLSVKSLIKLVSTTGIYYDKSGDSHYDCVSAFIKSIRGSDPDAALYYLARMIEGGEDPKFIARRLVISASEDVGNADPRALSVAVAGLQAVELVGLPEGGINLAQVTTYLASAPKSNKSYLGYKKALDLVRRTGNLSVPKPLRSAQTQLMKSLGHGKDYLYPHDHVKGWAEQSYLPEEVKSARLYEPVDRGFEKNIRQYQNWIKNNPNN